jgi:hypothetical protein
MRSYLSTRNSLSFFSISILLLGFSAASSFGQKPRIPTGGRVAVVVDERLAALRAAPNLSARLEQRLSRGRYVAIVGAQKTSDGLTFYDVKVSRRKHGWLQAGAVVSAAQAKDDDRLLRLLRGSDDFDLIVRARIFLDTFPRSPLRPAALELYAEAAEAAAGKLSRDASRRLNHDEMAAGGSPEFSYFMNFNGLDRYNRQGIRFVFDSTAKRFHYDGAAWREIVRRYPQSAEAMEARKRIETLKATAGK